MEANYYWPPEARTKHLYIAGRSGYGKSTLMFSLIMDDIVSGRSLAVIDPKGDLVAQPPEGDEPAGLLYYIPESRLNDCIFISPTNAIPIDFMSWHDAFDRELALNDIVALFHRLDPSWGVRMGALLKYAVKTLLVARRTSFMEIHRILVDETWRAELLKTIRDETITSFWNVEYKGLPKEAKSPITVSRMADFLLSESLRTFLGPNPRLNIQHEMESNKILLVSMGAVGNISDSGTILGSMIISKIQQALFRRQELPKLKRKPFALYVDEFQNFKPTAFNTMLTQARGFNLSACMANQHPKQLSEAGILDDMKGCVSSYAFFQMDADHAALLKGQIRPYEPEDIENLPIGRALYSMANGGRAFIRTPAPPGAPTREQIKNAEDIKNRTLSMPPFNTSDKNYTEGNGYTNSTAAKKEEPQETGSPDVPFHGGEKKNPRSPR